MNDPLLLRLKFHAQDGAKLIALLLWSLASALLICGCERMRWTGANSDTESASASKQSTQALPTEARAIEQRNLDQLYARLDARLQNVPIDSAWSPPQEIDLTLARVASNARINKTGCGMDFCRYVIEARDNRSVTDVPRWLKINGAIIYRYPSELSTTVIAYIFKPGADMQSL